MFDPRQKMFDPYQKIFDPRQKLLASPKKCWPKWKKSLIRAPTKARQPRWHTTRAFSGIEYWFLATFFVIEHFIVRFSNGMLGSLEYSKADDSISFGCWQTLSIAFHPNYTEFSLHLLYYHYCHLNSWRNNYFRPQGKGHVRRYWTEGFLIWIPVELQK